MQCHVGTGCISCSVALVGINRLVECMFALFFPCLAVTLTLLFHYKGDKTTVSWEILYEKCVFSSEYSVCVCVYDYNATLVRTSSGNEFYLSFVSQYTAVLSVTSVN